MSDPFPDYIKAYTKDFKEALERKSMASSFAEIAREKVKKIKDVKDSVETWETTPGSIRRLSQREYDDWVTMKPIEDTGVKNDQDKLRYDLIPPEALDSLARVLTFGANKYADRNWEKGMDWGRVFGACMRHLWAFWRGEDKDPETGYSHLEHAICNIAFLITYEKRNIGKDTRV